MNSYRFKLKDGMTTEVIIQSIENEAYISQFGGRVNLTSLDGEHYRFDLDLPSESMGGPFGSAIDKFVDENYEKWFVRPTVPDE